MKNHAIIPRMISELQHIILNLLSQRNKTFSFQL